MTRSEPNNRVESNRRCLPASRLVPKLGGPFCAPPALSPAVAHSKRSAAMIRILVPILIVALIACPFAIKSRDTRTAVATIASVPLGALLGLYAGGFVCYGVLRLQGRGGSHNDMLPMAAAGMAGLLVGAIALPLLAALLFKPKK